MVVKNEANKLLPWGSELLPLQVVVTDAAAVRSAVVMAAGAPSRGVIRHLDAVVSAVRTGGVQVPIALFSHL